MFEGERLRVSEYLLEVAKWGKKTSVARGTAIQTAEMVKDDLKTRSRAGFTLRHSGGLGNGKENQPGYFR